MITALWLPTLKPSQRDGLRFRHKSAMYRPQALSPFIIIT